MANFIGTKRDIDQNTGTGVMLVAEAVKIELQRVGVNPTRAREISDEVGGEMLQGGSGAGALVKGLRRIGLFAALALIVLAVVVSGSVGL